jgi:hypothetical protein
MKNILAFVFLMLPAGAYLPAQDVEFKASAEPNVLKVGEQFVILYESNQNISDIQLPDFNEFQFLGGPSVGQSTQIESSPGRTYSKTTYSYTYYYRAVKEGKFNVLPAIAKFKNKSIQSNSLVVEVLAGSTSSRPSTQPGQPSIQAAGTAGDDIYVRLILNKKEAYIGEQIVATVKLYTKLSLSGIDERYKGPDFTGFYTEPIEIPPLRNLERENVNGDIYYTGVLQKALLIPQKTGQLTVEPFNLDVAVRQQVKRRSNNIFDEFFEPSVQDVPVKLKSNSVKITIKPLPSNKPGSFTGAVGDFSLNASVDKTQVKTNDAVNYKITVKGTGNYKIVDEPVVSFPPDIEKYDPVVKTSSESPVTGTKTFEYLLIPHYPGEFSIPPIEFAFFNIQTKQFKTIHSQGFTIRVEKGENDTLPTIITGMAKEDIRLLGSDIQYIKLKNSKLLYNQNYLVNDLRYYLIFAGLLFVFALLLWIRRNHIRRISDKVMVRNRKANQYARRRLKKSALLLKAENRNEFYNELHKAVWLYLSDKLMISLADLSKDSARNALQEANIKEDVIQNVMEIINDCEFARYAPASETIRADQLYDNTVKLIAKLQQELN